MLFNCVENRMPRDLNLNHRINTIMAYSNLTRLMILSNIRIVTAIGSIAKVIRIHMYNLSPNIFNNFHFDLAAVVTTHQNFEIYSKQFTLNVPNYIIKLQYDSIMDYV
jgi:hypothetical protein